MKLINKEVADLMIFDEEGSLVVDLVTLSNSQIFYNHDEESYYIGVSDVAFDFNLHKFLHSEEKLTDFELAARDYTKSISVKKPKTKKCKLIGKTKFKEIGNNQDLDVKFECHDAELSDEITMSFDNMNYYDYEYYFKINEDSNGDFFKLKIK